MQGIKEVTVLQEAKRHFGQLQEGDIIQMKLFRLREEASEAKERPFCQVQEGLRVFDLDAGDPVRKEATFLHYLAALPLWSEPDVLESLAMPCTSSHHAAFTLSW